MGPFEFSWRMPSPRIAGFIGKAGGLKERQLSALRSDLTIVEVLAQQPQRPKEQKELMYWSFPTEKVSAFATLDQGAWDATDQFGVPFDTRVFS